MMNISLVTLLVVGLLFAGGMFGSAMWAVSVSDELRALKKRERERRSPPELGPAPPRDVDIDRPQVGVGVGFGRSRTGQLSVQLLVPHDNGATAIWLGADAAEWHAEQVLAVAKKLREAAGAEVVETGDTGQECGGVK